MFAKLGIRCVPKNTGNVLRTVSMKRFASTSSTTSTIVKTSRLKSFAKKTLKYSLLAGAAGSLVFSYAVYKELHPSPQIPQSPTFQNGSKRKNLVILGTGWGGVSLLQDLDTSLYNVIVISPRNYFLFTPLLPSTPVGTVDSKSIVEPIRSIARRTKGEVKYYEAEATDIDPVTKTISVKNNDSSKEDHKIDYDILVMSVGAASTTFNIPGVNEHAFFMKEISDAEKVRGKIIENIEQASLLKPDDPQRSKLLNFIVVGGGPTGVEFAAELQDFIKQDLSKWLPDISKEVNVSLIEALPNILNMFDNSLVKYTQDFIKNENVNLRLNTMVNKVDDEYITAKCNGELVQIPYGLLVWATGIKPNDLTVKLMKQLPEQTERRGLLINDKLQLLGSEDSIYALGDCTFHKGCAPTAQVAHQEGQYLAKVLNIRHEIDQVNYILQSTTDQANIKRLNKKLNHLSSKIKDFSYVHMGTMAYIGSDKAIVDLPNYKLSGGTFVFWIWRSAYLSMCISLRNRIMVTVDWIKLYFLGRNSSV